MNEPRAPQIVRVTPGLPPVPEPHPAAYDSHVAEEVYELIDTLCPQEELAAGKTIKRFEW